MADATSDLATVLAENRQLAPYRGRDVLGTTIAVRNAGDGLSEAMQIEPIELPIGFRGTLVLEFVVEAHDHRPLPKTGGLNLKQVLTAEAATLIDSGIVRDALEEQKRKIELARQVAKAAADEAAGKQRFENDEFALAAAHANGDHPEGERVEGCPVCAEAAKQAEPAWATDLAPRRASRSGRKASDRRAKGKP